jgi:PAS domain S-box-containing protein
MTNPRHRTAIGERASLSRLLLAILPPFVALILQLALWSLVRPLAWLLFYPAVFVSSWVGGLRAGVLATTLSVAAVLWFFIPPDHSLAAAPGHYLAAGVFFVTGILFGVFQEHLRSANRRTESALNASERAKQELEKISNERRIFAALIEHSSDFIGIADAEGKPVYLNPSGRRMVGLAADHPIEETSIADYYSADQRSFASDVIFKSMVENGQWQGETAFRHWQTQQAIPVSDTHFMIRDPDTGDLLGMGTITRDISDTKRARDEAEAGRHKLQQAKEAIATLVEQAPDGIFLADLDGRYTDVNSAGCHMLGYAREEIIGKTILDLIPADRVAQLESEKQQLLSGRVVASEWTLRRKDGTYLPVEVRARILPGGRWQGFVRDISLRKQLEQALRSSVSDLDRAQAVAKVGSWRLDLRRNELTWSAENYRIFGVPRGTRMTYEAFLACVHPDDRAYVDLEWKAALRGKPYDVEHRLLANGTTTWVREKAQLEFDEQGALLGAIGVSQDISDRKQHEQELSETRERLELALRGADLATWDWNIESSEVIFNSRWAEMRGFRPDEVQGHVNSWTSGVHPEDWPRVKQALDEYFSGRRAEYAVEHRVRRKSGEWIWVLDRGKVFARNERGAPIRMVGTELDITARKRAEEELRIAEAKSSGIISISADAIITVDESRRITLFNEGAERIFGYSKQEVLGAPLEILIPERYRADHRRHVDQFAAGRATAGRMGERGREILGLRKNGEEFPADAAISKLDVAGNRLLTVALRDVTEQVRLEREQKAIAEIGAVVAATLDYEETLNNIAQVAVRNLGDFCIVDVVEEREVRRQKIASRDPAMAPVCAQLGEIQLDRSQPHLTRAILEDRRPVLIEQVSREQLHSFAQSEQHLAALLALEPKSVILMPLLAHGRLMGALALVSSASSRAFGPADLRLAEALALRAALAIDNARLYRLATRAIELRDDVLGIVAHDLRNPLGTILIQASLLRRSGTEPERRSRKPADAIERAAKRMTRLINDLLDVARIEVGQFLIEQTSVSTSELVSDAVDAQRASAVAATVDLRSDLPLELPAVWADHDRLLQVFENLIGNAIKFTKPGGSITVGAATRDEEVLFWIADTGPGIASEDLSRVFDRFWQGAKGRRMGAGLGLPIVKGIVTAHDGRVWVESEPGHGSTFFFTIPVVRRKQRSARQAHEGPRSR